MVPDLSGWWCSEERVFPGRERQDERSNLPFPGQGWEGLGSAQPRRWTLRWGRTAVHALQTSIITTYALASRLFSLRLVT